MDKQIFNAEIMGILLSNRIEADARLNQLLYAKMKNDFTNEEFIAICTDILQNENLYNRYPTPFMFYSRKPKITPENLLETEKQSFLTKVSDYLDSGFITSDERQNFNTSLSEVEDRVLRRYGGISNLWSSVHRDNCPRSIDSVLRDVSQDFDLVWDADFSKSGQLKLKNAQLSGSPKISGVLSYE